MDFRPAVIAMVQALLEDPDADDIVAFMMRLYAKDSVDNARKLLRLSNTIVDDIIERGELEKRQAKEACYLVLAQQNMPKKNDPTYFASMVWVCRTMFPDGVKNVSSISEKRYLKRFSDMMNDPKCFSWKKDKDWADMHKLTDYLRMIEQQKDEINEKCKE